MYVSIVYICNIFVLCSMGQGVKVEGSLILDVNPSSANLTETIAC